MYNIYKELNRLMNYIEENIYNNIDISYLAHLVGLNTNILKNIFSCLTGISIQEYIRYRRLSLATKDILNGESITDVALKYQYSSLSSFTRAYKNFAGISPREIKNTSHLKLFNKITFKETINNYNLEYEIKSVEFNLYGISKVLPQNESQKYIKPFWEEVKKNIPEFKENIRYGFLFRNDEYKKYSCLLDIPFKGSQTINISKQKYFIYKIPNESSNFISESIKRGIVEYIKSLNYTYVDKPTIEVYDDTHNTVSLYIPIT